MILSATDGYIVDVIGPYICNGKNNDASITLDVFNQNINDLENYFQKLDVFVVDRGFRDSLEYLETRGYSTKMPSFLGKQKQHNSIESNNSRLITKIRWVIEAVNGRIKKWKYFFNVICNMNIPFIEKDFKNICAIINKFRPQIANSNDQENEVAYKKMMIIAKKENLFAKKAVAFKQFISKKKKQFDPSTISFPMLTEEYIQHLTFGIYQLKQARSYTNEHLDEQGNYMFELYEEEENILHVKLKSRHQSQTVHNIWIQYFPLFKLTEGQSPITDWYCSCKAGARILGMCAHITSVIWFLGVGRHLKIRTNLRKCDFYSKLCKDAKGPDVQSEEN